LFLLCKKEDIIFNVKIGFLLHLYQPFVQDSAILKEIAATCYIPLLKLIRSKKDFKITLNVPLSLLEQMDGHGYRDWISLLKDLVDSGKVELTGSAAYHPLLTKIPENYIEQQVILNEYGLGYYLGRRTGFEGESAILIKGLKGFYPPEMAVNMDLVNTIESLGYSWIITDETAISSDLKKRNGVFSLAGKQIKVVVRNRYISNTISFKRDLDSTNVISMLERENTPIIISLDAEAFGHHYNDGMHLLDSIIDILQQKEGDFITISEIVDDTDTVKIESIVESTWGASDIQMSQGEIYPFWDVQGNKIHEIQWKIMNDILDNVPVHEKLSMVEDYETTAIWNMTEVEKLPNDSIKKDVKLNLQINRSINSDQFWWASNKVLPNAGLLYHPGFIKKSLDLYKEIVSLYGDKELEDRVVNGIDDIYKLLDSSDSNSKEVSSGKNIENEKVDSEVKEQAAEDSHQNNDRKHKEDTNLFTIW
jgi:predicted glycosyl hydrolase (DUF1957 family)